MSISKLARFPLFPLVLAVVLTACSGAAQPGAALKSTETAKGPVAVATEPIAIPSSTPTTTPTATPEPNPLTITSMRTRNYPGSDIVVEQTLAPGSNYKRYIASYRSDGLKIYALLTVPTSPKPKTGFPVIVFNHGYIPPAQYKTTERYVAYVDAFARNGYIVFKSDYRGHGNSEGDAASGYGSPAYSVDVLNAVASVKTFKDADPNRIGMWGHSMGGQVTLRSMVVSHDIKAGVIWSGVVASYSNLLLHWRSATTPVARMATPIAVPQSFRRWRQELIDRYGTPDQNPPFWNSISPNAYVQDLSGPVQLHHSTADPEVPYQFSIELNQEIAAAGKPVEFYSYQGDDHNLSKNLTLALQRSVAFFDKYVKK